MKLLKILACLSLVSLLTACTCKPHKMIGADGNASDNIANAGDEGPLKDIYFAFDSYVLSSAAKTTMKSNAEWLAANPTAKVQVEGHCDERGTNEYNMVLGANRAKAGASYLKGLGVDSSRISTISYGEDIPADPAHNEAAWAKNRRDHFKVN